MRIEAIAIGESPPHDVNVIVEVPVGSQPIKYELDKDAGVLVVDRFARQPARRTARCTPHPSSSSPRTAPPTAGTERTSRSCLHEHRSA